MVNKKIFFIAAFALVFCIIVSSFASAYANPSIRVTLLNQDPDPIVRGDVVEVRFMVENLGTETSDDISIEIAPKYPFTLYSGNDTIDIGKMRTAQTGADAVIVRYKLQVDKNAVEGDNEIELYVKSNGQTIIPYTNNQFLISVKDYNVPDLRAYVTTSSANALKTRGTISVQVSNADKEDAKFVQLTLLPNDNYILLSPSNYVYIGDIASDDSASEDFDIYTLKSNNGIVTIPVSIEYQDTNQHKFEKQFDLAVKVYGSSDLKKYGFVTTSNTIYFVIVIVLAIAGYFFWKRRKKAKQ